MTTPDFPRLALALERFGVNSDWQPRDPDSSLLAAALEDVLSAVPGDVQSSILQGFGKALSEPRGRGSRRRSPFVLWVADQLEESGFALVADAFRRAWIETLDDPFELCELGRTLLVHSGADDLPLGLRDFETELANLEGAPLFLGAPAAGIEVTLPSSLDAELLVPLAIHSYGLAASSRMRLLVDVRSVIDWEGAWLGLIALDGLVAAFGAISDIEGVVATLILYDAWCDRVRDEFADVADEFLPQFEARVRESFEFVRGKLGLRKGQAIPLPLQSGGIMDATLKHWMEQQSSMMRRQMAMQRTHFETLQSLRHVLEERLPGSANTRIAEIGPIRRTVGEYIAAGESETVEFKQSLRWDSNRGSANKDLEKTIARTVAGFMNGKGGALVIGVHDKGGIVGIEADFSTLRRGPDKDGWELNLRNILDKYLSKMLCAGVEVAFTELGGVTVAVLHVKAQPSPVYLRDGETKEFHVRSGNRTVLLDIEDAHAYIKQQFPVGA